MTLREKALQLRRLIEQAAQGLDDETALTGVELFPTWTPGTSYTLGERIRHNGILWRCLQRHTSQDGWEPGVAPSMWAKVLIPDPEVIPDWEQPDSTNAYMKGDRVRFEGKIFESLIDNNVWSPAAYPAGWTEVVT